jgi:acetyl esterase/lipase
MKKNLFSALLACLAVLQTQAQTRYLDEVFDDVTVTSDVVYGENITVIPALQGMPPMMEDLKLDIYEPTGDTEDNRPLLLAFHTGNFLPPYINGGALGTKTDNYIVEMCTRYAKMGYVVASVDYRLGWNPLAGTQEERTIQLIQAAYRGVQDSRTAVRFFRKSDAESGNPYGINPDKIGMIGDGTGGYITLASATISDYNDIIVDDLGNPITKFWYNPGDGSYIPMVIESIHGDPNATTDTYAPASSGGFQLCAANHVGYSSDFSFQMNAGGALGDLNWLDEGDIPMVSFQCPHDPFAPYETSVLVVPTTNEPVVEVSGAMDIHEEINGYAANNNAIFANADLDDAGAPANLGYDGLFPVLNSYVDGSPTEPFDSSPWQWWDQAAVAAYDEAYGTNILATQLTLNPTMGEDEAMGWIEQMVDYNTPRMGLAMGVVTESTIDGGVRYIDEIFEDVTVESGVVYGENITVIPALQGMPPMAEDLLMDVYQPVGDSESDRPVILYFHTGNFLPQYVNGSAVGTRTDSSAVEICSRFARMGYVVASVDYRLGWNPLAGTQTERTTQLIQAAYRGVQDSRTAVRYFRKSIAEDGNPYGVSGDKIAMFGEGTGGYITLASSTISDYNDIIVDDAGNPITKFWFDPGDGSYIPVVIESIHGDPNATTNTYAPASSGGFQLCMANHVGYSSDFNFQMNLGGALGDLNWLDEGDMPMVSFHAPHDQFAPYTTGVLIVPTTNEPVVEVSGAFDVHDEINGYATNNNASFAEIGLVDPAAALGNNGWDGLYPVMNNYVDGAPSEPFDGSPWQWWDVATTQMVDEANGTNIAATQLTLNPTMGPEEAMPWIDIIQDYTAPRLAVSMQVVDLGPGCDDESACNYNALATTDDGSCIYAEEGFDCEGNSLVVFGCTSAIACNYNGSATDDDGTCDFNESTTIITGAESVWLVGVTLTGTENEAFAADCEAGGSVNPNVALNGVFLGDGTDGPMNFSNITDQTGGLLADLVGLAGAASISFCGDLIRFVEPLSGATVILSETNGVWQSAVPVIGASYLWAAPISSFNMGCGDPMACGFTDFCDLSVACDYTDTDGDTVLDCQEVVGCQDNTADNYNENATDEGDCSYNGCTDASAQNYEEGANVDDGSCTYLVSFRINMSNEVVADAGVHLAGSFQGWDPSAIIVPLVGYGVHEVVLQLQLGSYEYKFINGDAWGADESVGDCGNEGNRVIEVSGDTVTSGACFNSCDQCAGCADPFYAEYNPFNAAAEGYCLTAIALGCTYSDAENFNAAANVDDGSCEFATGSDCPGDLNDDGSIGTPDLLQFLSVFGYSCE